MRQPVGNISRLLPWSTTFCRSQSSCLMTALIWLNHWRIIHVNTFSVRMPDTSVWHFTNVWHQLTVNFHWGKIHWYCSISCNNWKRCLKMFITPMTLLMENLKNTIVFLPKIITVKNFTLSNPTYYTTIKNQTGCNIT